MTLQISGLTKRFNDEARLGRAALDRIDLEVDEHEAVALVGTSGCGKTTLLRIISGIERATGGRLTLRGDTVTWPRRDVGVVFQEPRLMPWLTARENIRICFSTSLPRSRQPPSATFCATWKSAISPARCLASYPAAWRSASPSLEPLLESRRSCCSMNRSAPSTISRGSSCSIISALFGRSPASL